MCARFEVTSSVGAATHLLDALYRANHIAKHLPDEEFQSVAVRSSVIFGVPSFVLLAQTRRAGEHAAGSGRRFPHVLFLAQQILVLQVPVHPRPLCKEPPASVRGIACGLCAANQHVTHWLCCLQISRQQAAHMDSALLRSYLSSQPQNKFLALEVRRENVVADTLAALSRATHDLHKPLKVTFRGEPGVDAGTLSPLCHLESAYSAPPSCSC